MKFQLVLRYVGIALITVSMLMAVSGLVALHSDDGSVLALFLSAYITFTVGTFPMIFTKQSREINTREAYFIVAFSWLAVCIFGMLPYILYGKPFTFTDALFESVSGFTTTGASILCDIESLPRGLLFWRAGTAWIGGFGIVTIFSLIIPKGYDIRSVLSSAEMSTIARSQTSRKGKSFILGMLAIYLLMTALCSLSLRLTHMTWFDAVTNAMCTCSTCGFCVRNNSIAFYDSPAVEYILSFFMVSAAISFVAIFSAFHKKSFVKFFKSEVLRWFLIVIGVATLLIVFDLLRANNYENFGDIFRTSLFQVCSIITTTGYATTDTSTWPALSVIVICIASIICGCSGSTSGGIKLDRAVILGKDLARNTRILLNPLRVMPVKVDGRLVGMPIITETKSYVLMYLIILLAAAFVNTLAGLDFGTGVSASIACLGNVGPGFGAVGSMGNYHDLPVLLKYTSMLLMIAGRLEIIPLVFVVRSLTART